MKKIAIVTGSAGLIGAEICRHFLAEGHLVIGADLFDSPNCTQSIVTDLSKESDIIQLFDAVSRSYGPPHILVNCGAISKTSSPILETSGDFYDKLLNVNLKGAYLCCREFVKANQGQDFGRIINISSTRWSQNEANWELYGMSKGGIVSLTNSLCVSLADTPITVNAISPGWIAGADEVFAPEDRDQHPSGRVGTPADIARTCAFFCHPSNDFINGANLIIDGGMTKKMIYVE